VYWLGLVEEEIKVHFVVVFPRCSESHHFASIPAVETGGCCAGMSNLHWHKLTDIAPGPTTRGKLIMRIRRKKVYVYAVFQTSTHSFLAA
jgi:hypothetical protein